MINLLQLICRHKQAPLGCLLATILGIAPLYTHAFTDIFGETDKNKLGKMSASMIKAAAIGKLLYPLDNDKHQDKLTPLHALSPYEPPLSASNIEIEYAHHYEDSVLLPDKVRAEFINTLIEYGRKGGAPLSEEKENKIRKNLMQIDINRTVGYALAARGLPQYSLTTATAYWLVSFLEVAQNKELTDKHLIAVYIQLNNELPKEDSENASDEEKQRVAELLMWEATLQNVIWQNARQAGAKAQLQKNASIARNLLLEKYNIDADRVVVTTKGVVPK